jgi:hypothetical protein
MLRVIPADAGVQGKAALYDRWTTAFAEVTSDIVTRSLRRCTVAETAAPI